MTSESVTLRGYRGSADMAGIDRVRSAVRAVEGDGWFPGPDAADAKAEQVQRCLIAEAAGEIVGYTWITWWRETNDIRLYLLLGWVDPAWRRRGIGGGLLRRQIEQAAELAPREGGVPVLGGNAGENQPATRDLLLRHGFTLAFTMAHLAQGLNPEPVLEVLPPDVELRPVTPGHYAGIHELIERCFGEDPFGYEPMTFEEFHRDEVEGKDLALWHVAWYGDRIVAMVVSEIDGDGISDTTWVAVSPEWRRRGLARTLLRHNLAVLAQRGVRTATISTVAENRSDTLNLYRGVGFEVVRRQPRYRRPL